jgi:hypothetical protein
MASIWKRRRSRMGGAIGLVKVQNANTAAPAGQPQFTGWCLDKEDLVLPSSVRSGRRIAIFVAKLCAFREKDRNLCVAKLCAFREKDRNLCVAKLCAFREKDRNFVVALLEARLVDAGVIHERLPSVERRGKTPARCRPCCDVVGVMDWSGLISRHVASRLAARPV